MTVSEIVPALTRSTPAPPVRVVHIGLGAFSRSHTAFYTHESADADQWGIAAYSGRSSELATHLGAQDGLYTLVSRDESGDEADVIGSVVRAHPGDDVAALVDDLAAPATAIVTLTITEAGYRAVNERPDVDDPLVMHDIDELGAVVGGRLALEDARPATVIGRLVLGLEARRRAGGGAIAVLSCDNLPDNGGRLERLLTAFAAAIPAPELDDWIDEQASFPSSSVDRITPRISDAELADLVARYGDRAPVVAEAFHDWVLSGDFPAGRPAWESAGARFVDDIEPWEARKLWLLNGAHTLLAAHGRLRGHATVAEAFADPKCRAAVERLWDDVEAVLPAELAVPAYRAALSRRFANPRIAHALEQIAQDARTKVILRIIPVAERLRAQARPAPGCAFAIAAWIVLADAHEASPIDEIVTGLSAALGADEALVDEISASVENLRDHK